MIKKFILPILCVILIAFSTGCAKEDTAQITVYFDSISQLDPNTIDCAQYSKENGFIKAEKHGNEYMVITMSQSRYEDFIDETRKTAMDSINECLCSYVLKIECNEDFTDNKIYVMADEYKNAFDLTELSVLGNAYYYQRHFGEKFSCKITVIDIDTGEIISSSTKTDI